MPSAFDFINLDTLEKVYMTLRRNSTLDLGSTTKLICNDITSIFEGALECQNIL